MKLANWDDYVVQRAKTQYAFSKDEKRRLEDRREAFRSSYCNVVTVVGHHEEHDECAYWCWMNVGPENGPCEQSFSTKPACTTCLAFRQEVKDSDGDTYWEFSDDIPRHEHEGDWQSSYIRKTGYDYGYCDYGFASPEAAERFRVWIASHEPHEYDLRTA